MKRTLKSRSITPPNKPRTKMGSRPRSFSKQETQPLLSSSKKRKIHDRTKPTTNIHRTPGLVLLSVSTEESTEVQISSINLRKLAKHRKGDEISKSRSSQSLDSDDSVNLKSSPTIATVYHDLGNRVDERSCYSNTSANRTAVNSKTRVSGDDESTCSTKGTDLFLPILFRSNHHAPIPDVKVFCSAASSENSSSSFHPRKPPIQMALNKNYGSARKADHFDRNDDDWSSMVASVLMNEDVSPLHPYAPTLFMLRQAAQDLLCFNWCVED